jgi:hypothetical protein
MHRAQRSKPSILLTTGAPAALSPGVSAQEPGADAWDLGGSAIEYGRAFSAAASPIDKADPDLAIDLSLGTSFGFQGPGTPTRRSSGAPITAGGTGDTGANPSPLQITSDLRTIESQ